MALQQFAAVALLLRVVSSQEVLVGTKTNFNDLIKEHDRILVEFYAPWCGHCKSLAPEYDKAATQLDEQGLKTKLMKVDATEEKWAATDYEVSGFPTLKYFKGGKPSEYGGGRTADTIVSWIKKRELGLWTKIEESGAEEFLNKANEGEFAVVARVKKGSVRDKAFLAALDSLTDYDASTLHFAVVHLAKKADAKKDSSLAMRRPGFDKVDEAVDITMAGAWSDNSVLKWILQSTYPTVAAGFRSALYGAEALEKLRGFGLGWEASVVAVVSEDDDDDDPDLADEGETTEKKQKVKEALPQKLRALMKEAVSSHPTWKFAVAKKSELEEGDKEMLAIESGDCVTVLAEKHKYRLLNTVENELADQAKVTEFLNQVKTKKAKPHYKSATPPETPLGEDNVMTLTGKTFEDVVLDSKKDVFVEFYAPWCGHCQKLEPIWSKIAKMSRKEGWDAKGLVIAKMDSTANECEIEVTGYPKLVFFPAVPAHKKMKAKMEYSGGREEDALLEFLVENAKSLAGHELKAEKKGKEAFDMAKRELERKKKAKAGKSDL